MSNLNGKRILIAEDEYLVALMAADMLERQGATIIGPAKSLQEGLELAEKESFDGAVLDANLRGSSSEEIAVMLKEKGIPFLFATGYGAHDVAGKLGVPVIEKPYSDRTLREAVTRLFEDDD